MNHEYVQVAFPIPIPQVFTYLVPRDLHGRLSLGSHVAAYLGKRRLSGFVVGFEPKPELRNIKPLLGLVRPEPVFESPLLTLTKEVAEYYLCPWGEVLAAAYPGHSGKGIHARAPGRKASGATRVSIVPSYGAAEREATVASPKGPVAEYDVEKSIEDASGVGVLPRGAPGQQVSPVTRREASPLSHLESELSRYLLPLLEASEGGNGRVFLTTLPDSSRERIYRFLVREITKRGGGVLFLVPEVSTSTSLRLMLHENFGERMAFFHSKLRVSEKKSIWEKCKVGFTRVLVGTRSAIFLPLINPRLIVVEDEHAEPYKQEETPRYNARDVAFMRSRFEHLPVLLASQTPLVETYHALGEGRITLLQGAPIHRKRASVSVVDMREKGNRHPSSDEFSCELMTSIEAALVERAKVLLFLNRRGHFTWIQCRDCGLVENCPHCELPLVYHSGTKSLTCHRCGYSAIPPTSCPKCGGARFRFGGAGIEKIQSVLQRIFPQARIARVDFDSARTRPDALRIAQGFARGDTDILIGTLMVTKGLELGEVSVVGVLRGEAQLNLPDFRSGERAFELLTDVVSLVHNSGGRTIIQTLNPDHHSVRAIASDDPALFYDQELKEREELTYPPFSSLVAFHVSGSSEQQVLRVVKCMATRGVEIVERSGGKIHMLGPASAVPVTFKGKTRWHMSLRANLRDDVREAAQELLSLFGGKHETAGVTISIDVDPV